MNRDYITVVSGLPRSGTSMMMKMLEASGMKILTDNLREADEDNPKGYYEFERVKKIEEDHSWLAEANGCAVKIISRLLLHLPNSHTYKVIFMRRKMEEILASQEQMLIRRGKPTNTVSDEKMAELFRKHLNQIEAWLAQQSNIDVIYIDYNDLLGDPHEHLRRINEFMGQTLEIEKMVSIIDHNLYRQRR